MAFSEYMNFKDPKLRFETHYQEYASWFFVLFLFQDEESETGSHGDIEDNLDDSKQTLGISIQDASGVLRHIKPFRQSHYA